MAPIVIGMFFGVNSIILSRISWGVYFEYESKNYESTVSDRGRKNQFLNG